MHYAAGACDHLTVQKLLDYECIRTSTSERAGVAVTGLASKTVAAVADMKRPSILVTSGRDRLRQRVSDTNCVTMTPRLAEQKALETNSSFEKTYTVSGEYKRALSAYINSQDYEGRTALHVAALNKNMLAMKALVRNGANMFIRDCKKQVRTESESGDRGQSTSRCIQR